MMQVILHVLCEGQTEETFVSKTLKPYLRQYNIVVKPTIIVTKRNASQQGGLVNYQRAKDDLSILLKNHVDNSIEKHYFTTMFDLYKLPTDFPEYAIHITKSDCYNVVKGLEVAFGNDIANSRFIPYIQLHEFESLVFAKLDELIADFPGKNKAIEQLKKELLSFKGNPELVNTKASPCTKLESALGKYTKVKSGPMVAYKAGIPFLKTKCLHFKEWIEKLENLK